MRATRRVLPPVVPLLLVLGCSAEPGGGSADFSSPEAEMGIVEIPVSTASEEARGHFEVGQAALDAGRFFAAREHFRRAVAVDSTFALAYLGLAISAGSPDERGSNLELAARSSESTSEGERLLIRIAELGFRNDREGQLAAAETLVESYPSSPRAWLSLARVQTALNQVSEARGALERAVEIDPDFAPAHLALSSSFLFTEPRNLRRAETHARHAVERMPEESRPEESLGDAFRAQNRLEEARDAYIRAAELDPENGVPLLKKGHIESLLGDYGQARADYDRAIELARDGQKAAFANYRAFTHLHAGDPQAAIAALDALVGSMEEIGVPEEQQAQQKIFALTNGATIALHHGLLTAAERVLEERAALLRAQAEQVGLEEFRRAQEASIVYFEGLLAARRGDFEGARAHAEELGRIVEPDANPRKMEPVHELLGLVSFLEGDAAAAILHYARADLQTDVCNAFRLGLAHEANGERREARALFRTVAEYNFNSVCFALLRREANQRLQ